MCLYAFTIYMVTLIGYNYINKVLVREIQSIYCPELGILGTDNVLIILSLLQ